MRRVTHIIQDACEKLAVSVIQDSLEAHGAAIKRESQLKKANFIEYLEIRGLTEEAIKTDDYYLSSVKHIPSFIEGFLAKYPGQKFTVEDIEVEARINNLKGDFLIKSNKGKSISFSLKNYKGGIRRPQVCSGTFNSFFCNFIFEQSGVGMYTYQHEGRNLRFKGSTIAKRDEALINLGYSETLKPLHELDLVQSNMRERILGTDEFAFFNQEKWKDLCGEVGNAGADLMFQLFKQIDKSLITKRILKSTGIIGDEELLAISKEEYLDSHTNTNFHRLRSQLQDSKIELKISRSGQTIIFDYILNHEEILKVNVPFTINSNGAWHRDPPAYSGTKPIRDKGEIFQLAYGQLRPRKSREIATSINTYLELGATGVFGG
jgi:hypothetical protein